MSKKNFFPLPLWDRLSKKMETRLDTLRAAGYFTDKCAEEYKMRLSSSTKEYETQKLAFFCLINPIDGVIADAKFQAYGDATLLALADLTATFIIGKTYAQVERTPKELLIKQYSEEKESFSFPEELNDHLDLILDTLSEVCQLCRDIPLEIRTPLLRDAKIEGSNYPDFLTLSKSEKISVIEEVMNQEVRPYVALDEGGVEILDLTSEHEVVIAYKGNCTSCYSSVGSTLSAIQNILQEKINSCLTVVPDQESLKF